MTAAATAPAVAEEAAVAVRLAERNDRAFVMSTWLRSFEQDYLMRRLRRARVVIACDPKDVDAIVGFAIVDGATLLYVYVREPLRGLGVARKMLTSVPIEKYWIATESFRTRIKPDERGWKPETESQ